jgi:hypothetical protein
VDSARDATDDPQRLLDVLLRAELRGEGVAHDAGAIDDEGDAAVDQAERALDAVGRGTLPPGSLSRTKGRL